MGSVLVCRVRLCVCRRATLRRYAGSTPDVPLCRWSLRGCVAADPQITEIAASQQGVAGVGGREPHRRDQLILIGRPARRNVGYLQCVSLEGDGHTLRPPLRQ